MGKVTVVPNVSYLFSAGTLTKDLGKTEHFNKIHQAHNNRTKGLG